MADCTSSIAVCITIFTGCSNTFEGIALAAYEDVVLVTVNYRVGVFGKTLKMCNHNKLFSFAYLF